MKNIEKADPRKVFGAAVSEIARENKDIVIISADSGGSSGFGDFKKEFPNRYFEFGIAEQGCVGMASGLATTGKIPVFCAIAPFVTLRPYEMFRNDIGYMRQNVKIVGRNSGISYSDLGSTHHSLEDFAIIRMIPGVKILAPEDPNEIKAAVKAMLECQDPVYMRMMEAADILEKRGIKVEVLAMPTVCPIDADLIEKSAAKTGRIITVEEHYVIGGLGSIVSELSAEKLNVPVKRLGVPHTYAVSGPYQELLAYYGLDAKSIADSVEKYLKA